MISIGRRSWRARIGLMLALAAAWWIGAACVGRAANAEVGEDEWARAATASVTSRSAATGGRGIGRVAHEHVGEDHDRGPRTATSAATDRSTATGGTGVASSAQKSSGGTAGDGPCGHAGEAEKGPVAGITAAHNAARCSIRASPPLPPLRWSTALAAVAQRYAEQLASKRCRLVHSSGRYGENLFWGTASYRPKDVVGAWLDEKKCFTHTAFPDCCSCTCGHYTQMVWRGTTRLGCGVARCARGGEVWVCNYDPPGNVIGKPVY
jgi:hypothetical protein